jgi:SAM-dependent methyltransferase
VKRCLVCDQRFAGENWSCPACGYAPAATPRLSFAQEPAGSEWGFEAEAFSVLESAERASFWFRARNRLIVQLLQRYFPQARSLLDVGCGTGYVLAGVRSAMPGLALTGGELFSAGLDVAASRLPGVPLYQLDARSIPFRDEFDVVGAFDVLEHIEDDERAITECAQAARPGGGLIVSVPQHAWLWSADDDYGRHCRRYARGDLVAKLERAGLRVVRATSFVSLLLPLMAISRRRRRTAGPGYDPQAEHHHSELLGSALERVLDGERWLIGRGVSFPAGGSLVVVAERV